MRPDRPSAKAFTLVELLVVIAIVAFLAALLMSGVSSAKTATRSTVCKNNLRQKGLALQMYVQDHGRYPYLRSVPEFGDSNLNDPWWWAKLARYGTLQWNNPHYHCPGYKGGISGALHRQGPFGSYAYNEEGVRPPIGGYNIPRGNFGLGPILYVSSPGRLPAASEPQIRMPSELMAIGESRFLSAQVNQYPGGRWFVDFWIGAAAILQSGLLIRRGMGKIIIRSFATGTSRE